MKGWIVLNETGKVAYLFIGHAPSRYKPADNDYNANIYHGYTWRCFSRKDVCFALKLNDPSIDGLKITDEPQQVDIILKS